MEIRDIGNCNRVVSRHPHNLRRQEERTACEAEQQNPSLDFRRSRLQSTYVQHDKKQNSISAGTTVENLSRGVEKIRAMKAAIKSRIQAIEVSDRGFFKMGVDTLHSRTSRIPAMTSILGPDQVLSTPMCHEQQQSELAEALSSEATHDDLVVSLLYEHIARLHSRMQSAADSLSSIKKDVERIMACKDEELAQQKILKSQASEVRDTQPPVPGSSSVVMEFDALFDFLSDGGCLSAASECGLGGGTLPHSLRATSPCLLSVGDRSPSPTGRPTRLGQESGHGFDGLATPSERRQARPDANNTYDYDAPLKNPLVPWPCGASESNGTRNTRRANGAAPARACRLYRVPFSFSV